MQKQDFKCTSAAKLPISPLHPDQYIDTAQAAALFSVSEVWLRQLRTIGGGPRFSKLGSAVRYRVGDVLDWAASKSMRSTSDAEAA